MDLWSNIWTAISTPNEGLVNIMLIPCSILESYLLVQIFTNILHIKKRKFSTLLYVIVSVLGSFITRNYIPEPFNAFLNYFIMFFAIIIIFKTSILKSILAVIIPVIMFALIGSLVLNPLVKAINIDYQIASNIPIYRITYILASYLVVAIFILILKHRNIYLKVLDDLDKKSKIILIANFILAITVFGIQAVIISFYYNYLPVIISFLGFLSLLAYFIISIYTLTRVTQLTLTKRQLENEKEYNETLQILHDNIRGFKHDYDNTVAAIGGYIKTNDLDGLKQYYSQLEDECLKVNRMYMLNPNIINNPGIYSLLTTKYNEAEELNIKMNITVLWDLSKINMKIYEFTKIFGILIDNAIDAAKESEEKIINVTFKDDEKNNMQYLKIENSYKDKNVDLNAIFEKGKTSKENHTGLGLWEIRKILKSNNNLNLHTTKDVKYFSQQFEIYN